MMVGPIATKFHIMIYWARGLAFDFFHNFWSKVKGQGRRKAKITFCVITPEWKVVETSDWYQNVMEIKTNNICI